MKIAVYTSIFGGYDSLQQPPYNPNVDYICYTDTHMISNTWKIVAAHANYSDSNRCAKEYKIIPHKFLSNYDYSIWVDGNITILGDVTDLISKYLDNFDIAFFDHNNTASDPRNCIYDEAPAVCRLGKDDPEIVKAQINKYKNLGYPKDNGLICGGVIVRRHNSPELIKCMEDWWKEIRNYSKRDQLSFNFVAWINKLKYNTIPGDIRNNSYFRLSKGHLKS